MPDITVNGVRIHCEERGSGTAMVWAHGLGGACLEWEGVMAFFAGCYRVVTYDAPEGTVARKSLPDRKHTRRI